MAQPNISKADIKENLHQAKTYGRPGIGITRRCLACCELTNHTDIIHIHKDMDYKHDHDYCRDCIQRLVELSLKNESVFPPKCCPKWKIPIMKASVFLSEEIVGKYHAKVEEYASGKRLYCAILNCSAFIPSGARGEKHGTCPTCTSETCVLCGALNHGGKCSMDFRYEKLRQKAAQTGWQTCGRCSRMIERNAGCNKIRYESRRTCIYIN